MPLFSEIFGQEKAIHLLKQAIVREKIPHAYLFAGIPGIGKTTTAKAFMQAVNCLEPAQGEACGHCQPCRQIQGGHSPDLVMIEPDGANIKIEQVRDLIRNLGFKPLLGRYRVTIIRRAEKMTVETANAFLKTLEEPPAQNILILNATEPLDLLPTIVSRCQQVIFKPLAPGLIAAWLQEHKGLSAAQASALAQVSGGSLGKALERSASDYAAWREEQLLKLEQMGEWPLEALLQMGLDYAGKEKKKNQDHGLSELLELWMTWHRDLLLVKCGLAVRFLLNPDRADELERQAGQVTVPDLIDRIMALDQAQMDLSNSRNVDLLMENIVLDLRKTY